MLPCRIDGLCDRIGLMRDNTAVDQRAAKLVEALLGDFFSAGQQGRFHALHTGLDQRKRTRCQPVKAKDRGAGGLLFHRHDHLLANGIGDDLQRGDHVAILDQLVMLDAGKRDPLVDRLTCFSPSRSKRTMPRPTA